MSVTHAIKVRGRLSDPRHIELDEPVADLSGPVDVVVSPVDPTDGDRNLTVAAARSSEAAFEKVWDNPEDAVYDDL